MHEMALVRSVVDIVLDKVTDVGASKVTTVHIAIGEGRDVVEDLFEGLFRHLAKGTIAEDAEIVIYDIPYLAKCNQCGFTFHVEVFDQSTWGCPHCGARQDYEVINGLEFYVSNIEIEAAPARGTALAS